MIETLSKQDALWRYYAYQICKDKDLADDLVGDMYLKLHNVDVEPINIKRFVYRTIQNLFLDMIRKQKQMPTVSIDEVFGLSVETNDQKHLRDCLSKLKWFDREILILTHEFSLRKAEEEVGVHYGVLNYHKKKALLKLKKLYNG